MYDRLLVPTDGSQATEETLEHALELARRYDASVHALGVVDERQFHRLDGKQRYETQNALRQSAEAAVDRIAARSTEIDRQITTAVRQGHPAAQITDYAAANAIDVIVIGTHGQTGNGVAPVGSVTQRVVETASIPVFVVHIGEENGQEG